MTLREFEDGVLRLRQEMKGQPYEVRLTFAGEAELLADCERVGLKPHDGTIFGVRLVRLHEGVVAAGEAFPMDVDDRERVDNEGRRWRTATGGVVVDLGAHPKTGFSFFGPDAFGLSHVAARFRATADAMDAEAERRRVKP